jgi:hypothetical protein
MNGAFSAYKSLVTRFPAAAGTSAATAVAATVTAIAAVTTAAATAITPTATAVSTASATAATTVGPTTAATFGFGPGFVHIESTSTELRSIQSRDRALRFRFIRHFDESKSPRTSRLAIRLDAYPLHVSIGFKQRPDTLFGCAEIEVAYKDIFHAVSFRDLKAS